MAAPIRRFVILCFCWSILLQLSVCIYEDQVGKFDWRQQYIGKVQYLHFDQSSSGKKIFVATNKNVISAINTKSGHLAWRKILEEDDSGKVNTLLHHKDVLLSLSGSGAYLRRWDTNYGHIAWETTACKENQQSKVHQVSAVLLGKKKDSIAILCDNTFIIAATADGEEETRQDLSESTTVSYRYLHATENAITAVGVTLQSHMTVVAMTMSGKMTVQRHIAAPWLSKDTRCILTSNSYLVCVNNDLIMYSVSVKDGGQSFHSTVTQALGITEVEIEIKAVHPSTRDMILYKTQGQAGVLEVTQTGVRMIKSISKAVVAQVIEIDSQPVLAALVKTSTEESEMVFYNIETKQDMSQLSSTVHTPLHHGEAVELQVFSFKRRDVFGYRSLIVFEDHALLLFQQSGKLVWSREEGLASLLAVEMLDLPVSEIEAKMEDEFGRKNDVVSMFVNRLKTQLSQLQTFMFELQEKILGVRQPQHDALDEPESLSAEEEKEYTRDDFNMHKMIVGISERGKLYGMDSLTGKLVWRHFLPGIRPFNRLGREKLLLYVQRTTAHFPHEPQCVILGKQKNGNGFLYFFNPITGKHIDMDSTVDGVAALDYPVMQAFLSSQTDTHFLKGLVLLGRDKKVQIIPHTLVNSVTEMYAYIVNQDTGLLQGYQIVPDETSAGLYSREIWTVSIPKDSQTIKNVVARNPLEHVHSHGRVLADRSVLYKYINPNLVVITTEGKDSTGFNFIGVYLVDTVTGSMVFQTTQKKAVGPIHVVHSENWLVYSYWNKKLRRNEITILELFEGSKQHNASVFSAFDPPPPPIVMRQSFILPVFVSTMGVTLTEMGLTAKHVLLALKNGPLAEMPKFFLDARRPVMLTPEHREEGILPYVPELPISYEYILNYNQSIYRIRSIYTTPTGLESTSLVLAYGLDIFFTRATPSKMFDVLKEDFDYFFISCVLTAMIVVSIVSRKLASRKALKHAWK